MRGAESVAVVDGNDADGNDAGGGSAMAVTTMTTTRPPDCEGPGGERGATGSDD